MVKLHRADGHFMFWLHLFKLFHILTYLIFKIKRFVDCCYRMIEEMVYGEKRLCCYDVLEKTLIGAGAI